MKLAMLLLTFIVLLNCTVGLRNEPHLSNYTRGSSVHQSPIDGVQFAGDFDPTVPASVLKLNAYSKKAKFMSDCLLKMSDEDAGKAWPDPLNRNPKSARSQFQGTLEAELQNWGWAEGPFPESLGDFGSPDGGANIKSALDALGLSSLPKPTGDHDFYAVNHQLAFVKDEHGNFLQPWDQVYDYNGQQYHRTGGACEFAINRVGGAIFARALYSPMKAAKEDWLRTRGVEPTWPMMPALRHASDIMTAYWLRKNLNPKGLRYYFALGIQNDETNRVIASILLDKEIYEMPRWPGVKVDLASGYWGFRALLGAPIGSTIAHILPQHKLELGIKHITEIVVFQQDEVTQDEGANDESDPPDDEEDPDDEEMDDEDEEEVAVHSLFKIEDVPPPKEDEEMPDASTHRHNGGRMIVRRDSGLEAGLSKRECVDGEGLRIHEFRLGSTLAVGISYCLIWLKKRGKMVV